MTKSTTTFYHRLTQATAEVKSDMSFSDIQKVLLRHKIALTTFIRELNKEYEITVSLFDNEHSVRAGTFNHFVDKSLSFEANWIRIFRTRAFLTAFALGLDSNTDRLDQDGKDESEHYPQEFDLTDISIKEANDVLKQYYNYKLEEAKAKTESPTEPSILKTEEEIIKAMVKEESKIITQ